MATVFKRSKQRGEPYTIQYFDHEGKRKTTTGFTDKGLSEQLASKLETDARLRSSGLIDSEQEQYALQKQLGLNELIEFFKESLAEKSKKYIAHTTSRLRRIVDDCDSRSWATLSPRPSKLACAKFGRRMESAIKPAITTCRRSTDSATGASRPSDY